MNVRPEVSAEDLARTPAKVLALLEWQAEQIRLLSEQVLVLTARVADLEAKLGKHPGNSSKPPSSLHSAAWHWWHF